MPLNHPILEIERPDFPSKFILCGEDDKDDEDLIMEIFAGIDSSFALFFVNNGRKLVTLLDKLPDDKLPCLLVLDYNMPELNGADILRELRQHGRYQSIPKVIWSTSGAGMYKQICMGLGAMDYIIKPSNVKEIQDVVTYMLSLCHRD